jgi:hypothetical protein
MAFQEHDIIHSAGVITCRIPLVPYQSINMSTPAKLFISLPSSEISAAMTGDRQLIAFCPPTVNVHFAFECDDELDRLHIKVVDGTITVLKSTTEEPAFVLHAHREIWEKYFLPVQDLGYVMLFQSVCPLTDCSFQSFWGE